MDSWQVQCVASHVGSRHNVAGGGQGVSLDILRFDFFGGNFSDGAKLRGDTSEAGVVCSGCSHQDMVYLYTKVKFITLPLRHQVGARNEV